MGEFVGIDYTKRKKSYVTFVLPVEMGSDEGFELSVLPPTKRGYDALVRVATVVDKWEDGKLEAEDFDMGAILGCVADVMSRNTQAHAVTAGFLESIGFDIEDVSDFIGSYMFFLARLVDEKNSSAPGPSPEAGA